MASSETSQALTKRSAETALMPPPPAPKRIKRPTTILDEDTYTDALSHIIARDFFPGLRETQTQQEYLNALESQDNKWIAEAGRKLTQIMTPGPDGRRIRGRRGTSMVTPLRGGGEETPSAWSRAETPMSTMPESEDGEEEEKKPEVDLNLSLSAFQAKYTSEDQESFNQLLDKANAKRFEKYQWLYDSNKLPSKQQLAQQKLLEAKAATKSISDATTSKEVALRPSADLDARPAQANTAPYKARNSLMFNPDSIEDYALTSFQRSEAASNAGPRVVIHHNTRLPTIDPNSADPSYPPSPTLSAVRDAIAGRPRPTDSEAGYAGSETPRVNGYKFVDAEVPEPEPELPAPRNLLERFGAIDNGPNPFRIDEAGRREKLHLKMVERLNGKNKANPGASKGSSLGIVGNDTPRFMSAPTKDTPRRGKVSLTPAAQKLFDRVGTPRDAHTGVFGGVGKGKESRLGREWTPTPKIKRKV